MSAWLISCLYMTVLCGAYIVTGYQWPSQSSDVAAYSTITATHTCTANTASTTCESTCPSRTAFPPKGTPLPLANPATECKKPTGSNIPGNSAAGAIQFDSGTVDCLSVDTTYSAVQYFTLSMWINVNCSDCDILNLGTVLKLQMTGGKLSLYGNLEELPKNIWHFVSIRYDGKTLFWYLNNSRKSPLTSVPTIPSTLLVSLGPKTNLTDQEFIKIADVQLYMNALTEREVVSLYSGNFKSLPIDSECRCPRLHPILVQNTIPKEYMKCQDTASLIVSRFNVNAKLPEFMNDNDTSTSWNSGSVPTVNVTISLKKSFQLHKLSLDGVTREADEMKIVLYKDNEERNVITIKQDCGSDTKCIKYSQTAHLFSHEFDEFLHDSTSIQRDDYEKIVADKVVIVIKPKDIFEISELRLFVRCNCYGNDGTCQVLDGTYTCTCSPDSNTGGTNCQTCSGTYYRDVKHLLCNIPCACDSTGSSATTCDELSGQCKCKTSVTGRKCDTCMHNTADLSSTGCAACPCNSDGITSCSDGPVCNCKNNVETASTHCTECRPNFYNITQPAGCLSCNCNSVGTMNGSQHDCHKTTGQCECKKLVEGRTCNQCKDESYDLSMSNLLTGCIKCGCNFVGSSGLNCDKMTGLCTCKMLRVPKLSKRNCEPTNLTLSPTYGPITGSTMLTITGHDLGEDVDLSFNIGTIPQTITERNNTHILITTKPGGSKGKKDIRLYWVDTDSTSYLPEEFNKEFTFEYRNDPTIDEPSKIPWNSYTSGGCTYRFHGNNLNSVAYPKIMLDGNKTYSICTGEPKMLICKTPDLTTYAPGDNITYGFYLDGVDDYHDVSTLRIVDDPNIETGNKADYSNTIDGVFRVGGSNLNLACQDEDVAILLDGEPCRIMSRANDYISCDPSEDFPGTSREVEVKVKIGNWVVVWGRLNIKSFWDTNVFIYIVIGVCAFFFLIIVIICIFCIRRRKQRKTKETNFVELEEHKNARISNPYDQAPTVAVINPLDNPQPVPKKRSSVEIVAEFCKRLNGSIGKVVKASVVDRSHIDVAKICTSKGKRVRIVKGTYNVASSSPDSGSNLTIKTLVDSYPDDDGPLPDWLNAGLSECTRLQDFSHENVLRMMGIGIDAKNIYILYPEMSKRTLKDLLSSSHEPLSDDLKMNLCLQVAMGMNYLSAQGITHKDLAARNCWVDKDDVVKVGDSSFAYDLYPEEYLHSGGRHQPVRWMAPECLTQGFYDTKSDVWSFGVVVWEVFTNGYLPYHDIKSNSEVKEKVTNQHFRLGKPHDCSDDLFNVIEKCHNDRVDDRPNFFLVVNHIESVIDPEPTGPVSYENTQDENIYANGPQSGPPPVPPKGRRK